MGERQEGAAGCPQCGMIDPPEPHVCVLADRSTQEERPAEGRGGSLRAVQSFGIDSLMLIVAVIGTCLGIGHEIPPLGLLVSLVAIPALAATTGFAARRAGAGRALSFGNKVRVFLLAFSGLALIEFSAFVAFCVTCFPVGLVSMNQQWGFNQLVFWIGVALGTVVGVATAIAVAGSFDRARWKVNREKQSG